MSESIDYPINQEFPITNYLRFLAGTDVLQLSPEDDKYLRFNDAGVEIEVGEFLYALVRISKPELVYETGTHKGIGAMYLGKGLKDNGFGRLHTHEYEPSHVRDAKRLIELTELADFVVVHQGNSLQINPVGQIDLLFLDTEPQIRFQEFVNLFPHVRPGGFVLIHDLHRHMHQIENEEHGFAWPYGKVPYEMLRLEQEGKIRPVHFGTPRGLTLFYKPTEHDYQWGQR